MLRREQHWLCWLLILLTSLYFAVSIICVTYIRWQAAPVILGFDETLVPVHKIPFPTITICPEIKQNHDIFNFTKVADQISQEIDKNQLFSNHNNFSQEELAYFAATLHICQDAVVRRFAPFITKDIFPDVAQTLVDLSVSKNETAPYCKWNARFYLCEQLFNFVATDEGICYQFNGLKAKDLYRDERFLSYNDHHEPDFNNYYVRHLPRLNNITGHWSLDDGYINQGYNSYPQRTVFSSVRNAFSAFLQGHEGDFDYACTNEGQGYKVFLNSPESFPLTTGNYILIPHDYEVMVSVLPQYVMSSEALHDFIPKKRQCYFNDERYLRFFRYYSLANCQTECLVNYTISKCGCAKFWMPKPLDTPSCGTSDISCYKAAHEELSIILQRQTIHQDERADVHCDCMPACTSLDYDFEISRARYDLGALMKAHREYEDLPHDFRAARLKVYFKQHQFTAIKRTSLFSGSTLIANWGGILGLFMGISSLSLIELVYFLSVRMFYNLRTRHATKRKLNQLQHDIMEENLSSLPTTKF